MARDGGKPPLVLSAGRERGRVTIFGIVVALAVSAILWTAAAILFLYIYHRL